VANPAWSYLLKFFFVPRLLVRGKNLNFFGLWDSLSRSDLVVVVQERPGRRCLVVVGMTHEIFSFFFLASFFGFSKFSLIWLRNF